MNLLSHLQPFPFSSHKKQRLGRGRSCGRGGTSTRGHKGQKARSGHNIPKGYEGGQLPLIRSLPKFGFTNKRFKVSYDLVNIEQLNQFDSEVNPQVLYEAGLVRKKTLVKILGQGKLEKALKIKAHKFSQSAGDLIKKAGGQIETIVLSQK